MHACVESSRLVERVRKRLAACLIHSVVCVLTSALCGCARAHEYRSMRVPDAGPSQAREGPGRAPGPAGPAQKPLGRRAYARPALAGPKPGISTVSGSMQ